ncbi:hypothetical protein [Nocardioides panacisoli]|uniref:hypothetical protein n=1 Tax=Nocardioides panacisoli TaxID=627624 RepID=UPI001F1B08B6|nr:hypothetical protein [Nocardioides panacisoli]
MPTADDLFRPTGGADGEQPAPARVRAVPDEPAPAEETSTAKKRASGRIRHDEKMTVYVTSAELMEIEQTRLQLRGGHGLTVDRGRLVREALHLVLEEFEAHGEDSALVRRLREQ